MCQFLIEAPFKSIHATNAWSQILSHYVKKNFNHFYITYYLTDGSWSHIRRQYVYVQYVTPHIPSLVLTIIVIAFWWCDEVQFNCGMDERRMNKKKIGDCRGAYLNLWHREMNNAQRRVFFSYTPIMIMNELRIFKSNEWLFNHEL